MTRGLNAALLRLGSESSVDVADSSSTLLLSSSLLLLLELNDRRCEETEARC